jgi:hypothetical protein
MTKPESMKVTELRAALKKQGLPTDGRKKDLLKRLLDSCASSDDTPDKETELALAAPTGIATTTTTAAAAAATTTTTTRSWARF